MEQGRGWRLAARGPHGTGLQNWPARCELIEEIKKAWSTRYGFEPLAVALPRFVRHNGLDHDADENYDALCARVKNEVTVNENRLKSLLGQLDAITGSIHNNSAHQTATQQQDRMNLPEPTRRRASPTNGGRSPTNPTWHRPALASTGCGRMSRVRCNAETLRCDSLSACNTSSATATSGIGQPRVSSSRASAMSMPPCGSVYTSGSKSRRTKTRLVRPTSATPSRRPHA